MNNDLISRYELLAKLKEWYNESKQREEANYEWETFESSGIESAMLCVESFPAIDAEPVRHGEWIYDPNATDWGIGGYVCSECHTRNNNLPCKEIKNPLRFAGSNFCPHCGARMDGGTKANG